MADRVVRNGIRDGLGVSVAFKSMTCPFLYTVKSYFFYVVSKKEISGHVHNHIRLYFHD